MKRKSIRAICLITICCASATIALGGYPSGYVWGVRNCGPLHEVNVTACNNCCDDAERNGVILPEDVYGCKLMCLDSEFLQLSWFQRWLLNRGPWLDGWF